MPVHDVTTTLRLAREELPEEGLHFNNTISLTFSGPGAASHQFDTIKRFIVTQSQGMISFEHFLSSYRLELPFKYFFTLDPRIDITYLTGRTVTLGNTSAIIQNANHEMKRVTLHWVPPTFQHELVRKIFTTFCSDNEVTSIRNQRAPNSDRWSALVNLEEVDIPHYVRLAIDDGSSINVMVSVPGRKTACKLCGCSDHWYLQCILRRRNPENTESSQATGETNFEAPPSYAAAASYPDPTLSTTQTRGGQEQRVITPSTGQHLPP